MKILFKNKKIEKKLNLQAIPVNLGLKNLKFQQLVNQLEFSFNKSYQEDVKNRVLKLHNMSAKKFELALIELKRFFILCSIMKNVPMYSKDVDIIWHEMLMFTKDYDLFCENFVGWKIHHIPNVPRLAKPSSPIDEYNKRVTFDTIYQMLFHVYDFNHLFLGKIYKDYPDDIENILNITLKLNEKVPECKFIQEEISYIK